MELPAENIALAATSLPVPPSAHQSVNPRTPPPPKPSKLPFEPIEENIGRLENYIKEQFANSTFNSAAPFPALNTPPASIHLKPGAIPKARHTPITVPHHWKEEVKKALDRDVERGIITGGGQVPGY